jgi:indole-3-glycerol phosphate synthase
MTILDTIRDLKIREVEKQKSSRPVKALEQSIHFKEPVRSMDEWLRNKDLHGIIAEFKRRSPSKGEINSTALPGKVCHDYFQAGASAISVLTDHEFFGGNQSDLMSARSNILCPVLRKEFIVDEYQVIESRAIGADAILLIAEIHDAAKLHMLHSLARSIGLEVLFEIHDEKSLDKIPPDTAIIGINSRDLTSFNVNTDHLTEMVPKLPTGTLKVAESGIKSIDEYLTLKKSGFDAFLIGEFFMKDTDPGAACRKFIHDINNHNG